ncbi:MAG: NAD(P)H-dependent oxidoreductase subunit E [Verrucomicrobiota bacterium]|jgi:NADH-quinone oxidoreductase subunit E|nr:NAD(P)H-dependent oxidoreductase subunit E [Verrucomicrobiota bacterium]MDP7049291.1 NAD(P)H-dependent oxidoreductase subunit E [Verrucomicrobiota bacterium]
MSLELPRKLDREINRLVKCYPEKRSASLMVLHALQEEFGYISPEAEVWAAARLGLKPINIRELVTFYPMLRSHDPGRTVVRVCRTLSCALAGSAKLHGHICRRLGLDANASGLQRTKDGKFGVEFAECLASCGTGPVMMCNDDFYENVSNDGVDQILEKYDE